MTDPPTASQSDALELARKLAATYEAELATVNSDVEGLMARKGQLQRLVTDLRREIEPSRDIWSGTAVTAEDLLMANGYRNGTPRTSKAIERVLGDLGRPVRAQEVYDELERRQWLPNAQHPRNAVRTTLWNLAQAGKIDSLGDKPANRRWATKTSDPLNAPGEKETVG